MCVDGHIIEITRIRFPLERKKRIKNCFIECDEFLFTKEAISWISLGPSAI
jgi:hypothetical protein